MQRLRSPRSRLTGDFVGLVVALLSTFGFTSHAPARRDGTPPIRTGASSGAGSGILGGIASTGLGKAAVVGAAGLVVVGSVGAGVVLFTGGNSADLSSVPDGVDTVQYTNVDKLSQDKAVESVVNKLLSLAEENGASDDTPENFEALKAELENETGLALEDLHTLTAFSKYSDNGSGVTRYSATILDADWSESELVAAIETNSDTELVASEENGVTVYKPEETPMFGEPQWVGVLGDGTYVAGTPAAVTDVINVTNGDADALSGDLKQTFQETRNGHVKFAARIPQDAIPAESLGQGTNLNTGAFNSVEMVSGAYYTDGNSMGVEVQFHATTESAARDIRDVTEGSVSLASGMVEVDEVKETLRNVEVTQDGATVTVTYENSVENINAVLDAVSEETNESASASESMGGSTTATESFSNIQAGVSVSSDAQENTITALWSSNQNADFLRVEYEVISGSGQTEVIKLTGVGDEHTYEGTDGQVVRVTVTAHAEGDSVVLVERETEL